MERRATLRHELLLILAALTVGCGHSGGGGGGLSSTAAGSTSAVATSTSSTSTSSGTTSSGTTSASTASSASTAPPIQYVFIIFKENHTYDNYFGSFPGGNGSMQAIDSKGVAFPLRPYFTELDLPGSNAWANAHTDWNGGSMNQFDLGEEKGFPFSLFSSFTHGPFVTYAPANGQASGPVKYYWQIAQQGALCDNYFTSMMGQSAPNHMYSVAATCGGRISNTNLLTGTCKVIDANGNVHDHPSHFTAAEIPTTLPNELEKKGLAWKYIEEGTGNNPLEKIIELFENNHDSTLACIDVATALPDFKQSYVRIDAVDKNLAGFLANGQAGNVTWIKPGPEACEHPGISVVSHGVEWTRQVVNAIGQSQYWSRCAIFITFDDFGGFYDHVSPPQVDRLGLGFRVPCTIVSPFAKKGFVDHTQFEHSSMLKFAERAFGIAPMTARDAASGDMTDAFDFTQPPRDFSEFHF